MSIITILPNELGFILFKNIENLDTFIYRILKWYDVETKKEIDIENILLKREDKEITEEVAEVIYKHLGGFFIKDSLNDLKTIINRTCFRPTIKFSHDPIIEEGPDFFLTSTSLDGAREDKKAMGINFINRRIEPLSSQELIDSRKFNLTFNVKKLPGEDVSEQVYL